MRAHRRPLHQHHPRLLLALLTLAATLSDLDAWRCAVCGQGHVVPSLATRCCKEWKRELDQQ